MKFKHLSIPEIILIKPKVIEDYRGYFMESYHIEKFHEYGIKYKFVQDNYVQSLKNTLRGLHFQKAPFEQSKLIKVSFGAIQDVIVDISSDSDTYGQWESYKLSSTNNRILFIPKGFAHGFLVLSNEAVVNYKVDSKHSPEHESGIRYDDKNLGVTWNLSNEDIIVSDRDKELPNFQK